MYIFDLQTHLRVTFLNVGERFFGTKLNGFEYCLKTITILHQSFICSRSVLYLSHK